MCIHNRMQPSAMILARITGLSHRQRRFLWGHIALLSAAVVVSALPVTLTTTAAPIIARNARRRWTTTPELASSPAWLLRGGGEGASLRSNKSKTAALTEIIADEILVSNGLRNLGNTCYMNAQLQCAFHIPAVRSIIMSPPLSVQTTKTSKNNEKVGDHDTSTSLSSDTAAITTTETGDDDASEVATRASGTGDEVNTQSPDPPTPAALAMKELFEGMVISASTSARTETTKTAGATSTFGITGRASGAYTPRDFVVKLGIPTMVQQDSQEFWKLLLPAVGSERLTDLYKGIYEDYIVALDGSGHERRKDELFLDLSVDVAGSSNLLESLKSTFGEPELLSVKDGNGWRPVKGAEKVDAHKGSSLVANALPPILQFHLKRFNYDWETGKITKINKQFTFPESLDLNTICSTTTTKQKDEIGDNASSPSKANDGDEASCCVDSEYDLQSVIVHLGEFEVGHYYAYVRPDVRSGRWYRFNDDIVEEVSFEDVQRDAFGGKVHNHIISCTAKRPQQQPDATKSTNVAEKTGLFTKLSRSVLRRRRRPKHFGFGGETSNAYILQYVRRSDIPMLYDMESTKP